MSVRPIDFNGMIQNTAEVSNQKTQENERPEIQQNNIVINQQKNNDEKSTSVNQMNEKDQEYRYGDGEGNGRGYNGNQNQKKKDKSEYESDGTVTKKGEYHSFDISV